MRVWSQAGQLRWPYDHPASLALALMMRSHKDLLAACPTPEHRAVVEHYISCSRQTPMVMLYALLSWLGALLIFFFIAHLVFTH
jgi:hypothetical protein